MLSLASLPRVAISHILLLLDIETLYSLREIAMSLSGFYILLSELKFSIDRRLKLDATLMERLGVDFSIIELMKSYSVCVEGACIDRALLGAAANVEPGASDLTFMSSIFDKDDGLRGFRSELIYNAQYDTTCSPSMWDLVERGAGSEDLGYAGYPVRRNKYILDLKNVDFVDLEGPAERGRGHDLMVSTLVSRIPGLEHRRNVLLSEYSVLYSNRHPSFNYIIGSVFIVPFTTIWNPYGSGVAHSLSTLDTLCRIGVFWKGKYSCAERIVSHSTLLS